MKSTIELQDLKVAVSERTKPVVFWTGAGLSCPSIPNWRGLRDALIDVAKAKSQSMTSEDQKTTLREINSIKDQKTLWVQLGRLRNILGTETFNTEIKRIVGVSNTEIVPKPYELIWALAPAGVVTFNLDLYIQRAATAHPRGYIPIPIRPSGFASSMNFLKERRPFVAYPHGHLDEPNHWVFTHHDIERVLNDANYLEWLNILFRSAIVVFVGITADDIAISEFIRKIKDRTGCDLSGNFWITDRADRSTDDWANKQGIRVIRYANTDGSHGELCDILKDLTHPLKDDDQTKLAPVVFSGASSTTEDIPTPEVLVNDTEENIRNWLNVKAAQILRISNTKDRDDEYELFLNKYGRSIHRSWYASPIPGEDMFLGYHLLREVTGGAFGTVFEAMSQNGERVAIKILKPENFRKVGFFKNFRRGVNSLRIITNRGINGVVGFLDAAEIPPTLIMEWVDGQTLNELVDARQLGDWETRVKISLQLSTVIKEAHNVPERVFHRDLRPANIIINNYYLDSSSWKVVVLDFDLSWHKGAEDHSIMHSPAFGYLAPEQRRKMARQTTRSALVDSYGFGMTLYFLCTGKNPFPDQHLLDSWENDLFAQVCKLSCGNWISLPRRISRIILNSTKNDQAARWSMLQIQGELDSLNRVLNGDVEGVLSEIIVEELAARTEHLRGYAWSDIDSEATISRPNGLALSLKASADGQLISFSASWQNGGDQDWTQIDRVIQKGVPKFIQTLEEGGWCVSQKRVYRGFSIAADIDQDKIALNPDGAGKLLDRAIGHATAISSF